jgi:hypothetical protein
LAALVKAFDELECWTRITEQNIKEEQEISTVVLESAAPRLNRFAR